MNPGTTETGFKLNLHRSEDYDKFIPTPFQLFSAAALKWEFKKTNYSTCWVENKQLYTWVEGRSTLHPPSSSSVQATGGQIIPVFASRSQHPPNLNDEYEISKVDLLYVKDMHPWLFQLSFDGDIQRDSNGNHCSPRTYIHPPFWLVPDTGSSDTWVLAEDNPKLNWRSSVLGKPRFWSLRDAPNAELVKDEPWLKATYGLDKSPWKIQGEWYKQAIILDANRASNGDLVSLYFPIHYGVVRHFENVVLGNWSGVLGLGFSSDGRAQDPRLVSTAVSRFFNNASIKVERNVICMKLRDRKEDGSSFITFGYIPSDFPPLQNFIALPVIGNTWRVAWTALEIQGEITFSRTFPPRPVVIDSGSHDIYALDMTLVDDFYRALDPHCEHSKVAKFTGHAVNLNRKGVISRSTIVFHFAGGGSVSLPGRILFGGTNRHLNTRTRDRGDFFQGTIQAAGCEKFDIFGTVFLQELYAVFDFGSELEHGDDAQILLN